MRTLEEIVAWYTARAGDDVLGFAGDVVLPYLPATRAQPFLKPDADLSTWEAPRCPGQADIAPDGAAAGGGLGGAAQEEYAAQQLGRTGRAAGVLALA